MTNQEEQIEPFVSIPRYVLDDLRDGVITPREFEVYVLVRLQANPYGIATVSIESILADKPALKSTDWTSKVMRSLRCPRYLYFEVRQGHRGSFRVHFGNWKMPNKIIRQITNLFSEDELRSLPPQKRMETSEEGAKSYASTPKSESTNNVIEQADLVSPQIDELRSSHNDTDTHNAIDTKLASTPVRKERTWKEIPTNGFQWKNDDEKRCYEIAIEVGEEFMDFILSRLNHEDGGIKVIEEGYERWQEVLRAAESQCDDIRNPAALFNYCLRQAQDDNRLDKLGQL